MSKLKRFLTGISLSILLFNSMAVYSLSVPVHADFWDDYGDHLLEDIIISGLKDTFYGVCGKFISHYTSLNEGVAIALCKEMGWTIEYMYAGMEYLDSNAIKEVQAFDTVVAYYYARSADSSTNQLHCLSFNIGSVTTSESFAVPLIFCDDGSYFWCSYDQQPITYTVRVSQRAAAWVRYDFRPEKTGSIYSSAGLISSDGFYYYSSGSATYYSFRTGSSIPTWPSDGNLTTWIRSASAADANLAGSAVTASTSAYSFNPSDFQGSFEDFYNGIVDEFGEDVAQELYIPEFPDINLPGFILPPNLPYETFPEMTMPEMDASIIESAKNGIAFHFELLNKIIDTFNIQWLVILMLLVAVFFMIFAR